MSANIANVTTLRILTMIQKLHEKQWTLEELAIEMAVSKRTIYRYVHLIKEIAPDSILEYNSEESTGHQGGGIGKLVIQMKDCPFCGKNVNNFSIARLVKC